MNYNHLYSCLEYCAIIPELWNRGQWPILCIVTGPQTHWKLALDYGTLLITKVKLQLCKKLTPTMQKQHETSMIFLEIKYSSGITHYTVDTVSQWKTCQLLSVFASKQFSPLLVQFLSGNSWRSFCEPFSCLKLLTILKW